MWWINELKKSKFEEQINGEDTIQKRTNISFKVKKDTRCWRHTRHEFVVDTAPFFFDTVDGDFEVTVCIHGAKFKHHNDQAGIMVREKKNNWMTCGLQLIKKTEKPFHKVQTTTKVYATSTVTREYSDWSLHAIPQAICDPILASRGFNSSGKGFCNYTAEDGIYFVIKRMKNCLESYYSIDGMNTWEQMRQCELTEEESLKVGLYAASPTGEGFKVYFTNFKTESSTPKRQSVYFSDGENSFVDSEAS